MPGLWSRLKRVGLRQKVLIATKGIICGGTGQVWLQRSAPSRARGAFLSQTISEVMPGRETTCRRSAQPGAHDGCQSAALRSGAHHKADALLLQIVLGLNVEVACKVCALDWTLQHVVLAGAHPAEHSCSTWQPHLGANHGQLGPRDVQPNPQRLDLQQGAASRVCCCGCPPPRAGARLMLPEMLVVDELVEQEDGAGHDPVAEQAESVQRACKQVCAASSVSTPAGAPSRRTPAPTRPHRSRCAGSRGVGACMQRPAWPSPPWPAVFQV